MFKQAWRSYMASLHSGNLEKMRNQLGYLWMYLVLCMSWGIQSLISDQTYADAIWACFLRLSPIALMLWSDLVSKHLMPKNMFLCPMKEEERKKYMNCVLTIKIGVVVITGIIVELIWSIFYGFSVIRMSIVVFAFLSIAIANYIEIGFKNLDNRNAPFVLREKNGDFLITGMNTLSVVVMMVLMFLITSADIDKPIKEGDTILLTVFVILCVIILLVFDIVILLSQYKYLIVQSADYELHFKVKGKVESPKKKYKLSI